MRFFGSSSLETRRHCCRRKRFSLSLSLSLSAMISLALCSQCPPTVSRASTRSFITLRSRLSLSKSLPSDGSNCTSVSYPSQLRFHASSSCNPFPKSKFSKFSVQSSPMPHPPYQSVDASVNSSVSRSGTKIIPFIVSVSVGLIVRFLVPKPHQLSHQAWQLLAIFLSTITGLVLSPLPVGAWAFLALTTAVISKTLTFSAAFSAFTSEVIWLIVVSFFFARGFVKTGLGDRIATYFVKWMGKSTLGLSYGLVICETVIAPAMPSATARAGGIFLPIIKSLSISSGSLPKDSSAKKLGSYLVHSQFQSAGNSSALFLTAAAQNMLCLKLAEELGVKFPNPWISWFKAASLPAIICILATPLILYKICPPEIKETPDAPSMATRKLQDMGPVTRNEWAMIGTMLLAVSLWIMGDALGIPSVVAAMLGLSILLLLGVLDWDDCLSEKSAWDTLAWFAVLVGMAGQLTTLGVISWVSNAVGNLLNSPSLRWPATFLILQAAYFFTHYLFASQTAHVGALYSAFLAMSLTGKVPASLAALALAYNTNLFGALTHYSSGQAAVYYGAGYVDLPDIFKVGILMALINIVIWAVIGPFWWKLMGLY